MVGEPEPTRYTCGGPATVGCLNANAEAASPAVTVFQLPTVPLRIGMTEQLGIGYDNDRKGKLTFMGGGLRGYSVGSAQMLYHRPSCCSQTVIALPLESMATSGLQPPLMFVPIRVA